MLEYYLYSLLPIWKHFYEFFGRPFSCGLLYVFYIFGYSKSPGKQVFGDNPFRKVILSVTNKSQTHFFVLDRRVMYLFRQNPPLRNASTPSEQIKVYLKSDSLFSCTDFLTHGGRRRGRKCLKKVREKVEKKVEKKLQKS